VSAILRLTNDFGVFAQKAFFTESRIFAENTLCQPKTAHTDVVTSI
jgi:hypothetical protein